MPLGIEDFIKVASGLPDFTPLSVKKDTVILTPEKRGVTHAESMRANAETAKIFLNVVRSHPKYAAAKEAVESVISHLDDGRYRLYAQDVERVVACFKLAPAEQLRKELTKAGILPGPSSNIFQVGFGQYVASTFGFLEGEHAVRMAVRSYLIDKVIGAPMGEGLTGIDTALDGMEQNAGTLSREETEDIQRTLYLYHGAKSMNDYMRTMVIKTIEKGLQPGAPAHPTFGKGLAELAEVGITKLFAKVNRDEIRLLAALPRSARDEVQKNPNLLHALMEGRNSLSPSEHVDFIRYVTDNQLSLNSPAERQTVVRDFLFVQSALHMQSPLPSGLPTQFSLPLALNPDVKNKALAMLQADLGPGVLPTRKQLDTALLQARDAFATSHAPLLNEFVQMAMNPPAGLTIDPPLTPQTLPHYLNTLLSGDAVLEPLFNDSHPVDTDYLRNVLSYDQSIESARDVSKKDFGADDANKLHENAMRCLMARRGVGGTEYPAMMERGIARFSRMISELNTLSDASFKQGKDPAQRDVVAIRRLLSSTIMNVAELLTPANRKVLGLSQDTDKMMSQVLTPLSQSCPPNELSTQMHAFGVSIGIQLPPTSGAAAKNAMEQQLREANDKIVDSTLARILGDVNQLRERTTPFVEMASDLIADLGLIHLDASLLEPKLFFDNASELLHEMAAEAASQNATLNEGALKSALRQSIAMQLTGMDSLVAQIESMKEPKHLSKEQHKAQKSIMKDMVHLHPITDLTMLTRLMDRAASSNGALEKLRAPLGTPLSIALAVATLATDYTDLAHLFGPNAMPPQSVGLPCFLEMTLRASKVDAATAAQIQQNITGTAGKSVAASCKFILDSDNYTAKQKVKPQQNHALMTHLATMSEVIAKGKATHDPQLFSAGLKHLSEIPSGCLSTLVPNNTTMQHKLNLFSSHLSSAEWDLLERTGDALSRDMPDLEQTTLASILTSNTSSILKAASDAGNPDVLTLNQVATAVLGSPLTSQEMKNGATDGNRLSNAFVSRYTREVRASFPDASATRIQTALSMGMANGFSFPVLKSLANPAGKLTLADMPPEALELGSLGGYTAENAFGLREDFPRLHGGSITLNDAGGKKTYSPSLLPPGGNIPANNEVFQGIITNVTALSSSEVQKLRIMHLFTQAGRKCAGMSAQAFPSGAQLSGFVFAMDYSVARATGKDVASAESKNVVVTMKSLKNNPLYIEQEFLVDKDGGYKITKFLMERRSASEKNPVQPEQA